MKVVGRAGASLLRQNLKRSPCRGLSVISRGAQTLRGGSRFNWAAKGCYAYARERRVAYLISSKEQTRKREEMVRNDVTGC